MIEGMIRVEAIAPQVHLADVDSNVDTIAHAIAESDADIIAFPELSLTGYTCGDLLHNSLLLEAASTGLTRLARLIESSRALTIVGLPLKVGSAVYNCAAAITGGQVIAIVPKTYIPNYNEFYEYRWFAIPNSLTLPPTATIGGEDIPFGTHQLIRAHGATIGIEICEDLWAPVPPSSHQTLAGANVIVNLSASNDLIGKRDYLRSLIAQQSARCTCAYIYASAGWGESTTDLVFDGKCIIAENGRILAESPRWQMGATNSRADIDLEAINRDRIHNRTFEQCAANESVNLFSVVDAKLTNAGSSRPTDSLRYVDPHPFVPSSARHLAERCDEIINIQALGLARRFRASHSKTIVVGISGGLDSTLALLVACKTMDLLSEPRSAIIGVTMPGFGTTGRTYSNALQLMESLGVTIRETPISAAVMQHFSDIGHDPAMTDVTYENSQARERTQILMDLANQMSGMVLGTGDLSELALGWATYNGDHMSMYGVNAGVPKTLVRHLVTYFAETTDEESTRRVLLDIVDTPISPELTPADASGNIAQKTEDLVGPYELHDFFLYYTLRYGFAPRRIFQLATNAKFDTDYSRATIAKWLRTFLRRFFAQQFKRSCLPDGPKVGSVCLSPRGDWRMPSDATAALWLADIDRICAE